MLLAVAGRATSVPGTATSVPDTATSVPDTATSVPDTATSVPDTATSVPEIERAVPEATPPGPCTNSQKISAPLDLLYKMSIVPTFENFYRKSYVGARALHKILKKLAYHWIYYIIGL